jgi:hypothetical protein
VCKRSPLDIRGDVTVKIVATKKHSVVAVRREEVVYLEQFRNS